MLARLKNGFTLLELLVVISIIGILIAMSVVSFTTAQKNGRDAKRLGDLKNVQNAFEQYYAVNNSYPDCNNSTQVKTVMPNGFPAGPRPSETYTKNTCTSTAYCICATLEKTGTGNSNVNNCTGLGTAGNYQCVGNLQ